MLTEKMPMLWRGTCYHLRNRIRWHQQTRQHSLRSNQLKRGSNALLRPSKEPWRNNGQLLFSFFLNNYWKLSMKLWQQLFWIHQSSFWFCFAANTMQISCGILWTFSHLLKIPSWKFYRRWICWNKLISIRILEGMLKSFGILWTFLRWSRFVNSRPGFFGVSWKTLKHTNSISKIFELLIKINWLTRIDELPKH